MPRYDYRCPDGHLTIDVVAGYEDSFVVCRCDKIAERVAVYREQGVIFKGTGFTRTVIPPAPPKANTKEGEPVADWEEKLHEYAEDQYSDDENLRGERKRQLRQMGKEVQRGKGFKRT